MLTSLIPAFNSKGVDSYRQFINGEWVSGHGPLIDIINPSDGTVIAKVESSTDSDVDSALEAAAAAFVTWRNTTAKYRADLLMRLTMLIDERRRDLARLLTMEQGKPLSQADSDIQFCIELIRYAAEHARHIQGDIIPADNPQEQIWIQKVPHGVIAGITAWNFPAALVGRKIGPALATGNTIVLKPSEETPLTALAIANLAQEADIPAGVINVINGFGRDVGQRLVTHPLTDLVSMTGSIRGGREINQSVARYMKIVRLELGGKAPFIVMDDADMDRAVDAAITARFANSGQACTCNERMYVHERVYKEFLDRFLNRVKALKTGNPIVNQDVDLGPKINKKELEKIDAMVTAARSDGAQVLTGGHILAGQEYCGGFYYEPTVLANVHNSMDIMQKEIFGPVVPIMPIESFENALKYANQSNYGLSAYVFTKDVSRIMSLVSDLDFGELYINRTCGESVQGFHHGYRDSGLGGEDGKYGIEAYVKTKTMYVRW